mgnify:CR=1 FL=1
METRGGCIMYSDVFCKVYNEFGWNYYPEIFGEQLLIWLKQNGIGEFALLGPAPCPILKINYNFRYRLTLRCAMTKQLRGLIAHLLRQFSQDRENRGVTAFIDVNGYD